MDEVIKKGEAPGSGGRSLEHGSDPRSGHVPSRLLVELRLAGEAAEHMHVPRMRALAWRSVVEGYATNRILGHFERLLSACNRWLQTPPGSGAGSGDSGRVALPDLVLHRADEEFVVNALDAPGTAGDATHLVLDPFGADAADQRDHPLRGAHVDVPGLDLGLGDQRRLDRRRDPGFRTPRFLGHHRGTVPGKRQQPGTDQGGCHRNEYAFHELPRFPNTFPT